MKDCLLRKLKLMNSNRAKLAVSLIIAAGLGSCTAISSEGIIPEEEAVILYRNSDYTTQVNSLLKLYQIRSGADTALLSVFDVSYTYRIIYASVGIPSETPPDEVPVAISGWDYIYEEMKDGQTAYILMEDLKSSELKSNLTKGEVKSFVVSPVNTTEGYLLGYVALSWKGTSSLPDETSAILNASSLAREISALSWLIQ